MSAVPLIASELDAARGHHRAGRLAEAEAGYRRILARDQNDADALHALGVLAHQTGHSGPAAELIGRAVALRPAEAHFHNNLGEVLRATGQVGAAADAYRRALRVRPGDPVALNGLAFALASLGRPGEAVPWLREAVRRAPTAEAWSNLGAAVESTGDDAEAEACYRAAIAADPANVVARANLAALLRRTRRLDEAAAAYRSVVDRAPSDATARNDLGVTLEMAGRLDEATACFREAARLDPGYPPAHQNLGAALASADQFDEALATFHAAVALAPDDARAWGSLASAFEQVGRLDDAVGAYRRSLALIPDAAVHSSLLFALLHHPSATPEAVFAEHVEWDARYSTEPGRVAPDGPQARLARQLTPDGSLAPVASAGVASPRRLRVGYLSPDFREHPVAFFLEGILASHDRSAVEVFCYSDVREPDATTRRFEGYADVWRPLAGRSDDDAAAQVRADRIDVLVDLAGHTRGNRLGAFARRPAPVQVTYLGHQATTGLRTMDYRLTDALVDPPGRTDRYHTEALVRLPRTFACYSPPADAPPVGPPPALRSGRVTFGVVSRVAKLSPAALQSFARVLAGVPNSDVLFMTIGMGDEAWSRVVAAFAAEGIDAARLARVGRQSLGDYLARHHAVDVVLDTYPFNGHTTTCHALWMGVPVVTLAGDTYVSRMGLSVLTNVGLPELIARTPKQFVETAAALASDLPRLSDLRAGLRDRMRQSPLLDHRGFTRDLEAAYQMVWEERCATTSGGSRGTTR